MNKPKKITSKARSHLTPEILGAIYDLRIDDMIRLAVAAGLDVEIELSMTKDGSPGRVRFIDGTLEPMGE